MPGAFEGETVTRRRFMTGVAHSAGGIAAMAFTLPALGFALGPIFDREPFQWQIIGKPEDFTELGYVTKALTIVAGIGEAGQSIAYVRKRDPAIDSEPLFKHNGYVLNNFVALSSRCMHLGCPVRYVEAAERFICPCHGGVYNFRGEVAGGPPVRPLDRFYTLEHDGYVYIGPAVLGELRTRALLAARPGGTAGRHRTVPLPGARLNLRAAVHRQPAGTAGCARGLIECRYPSF